jgi:hypothetical protein
MLDVIGIQVAGHGAPLAEPVLTLHSTHEELEWPIVAIQAAARRRKLVNEHRQRTTPFDCTSSAPEKLRYYQCVALPEMQTGNSRETSLVGLPTRARLGLEGKKRNAEGASRQHALPRF